GQALSRVARRLGRVRLGGLVHMPPPPDDHGVPALHMGALQVGVGVAARHDPEPVPVGVRPPVLAHLAADPPDQLSPVARPLTHPGLPHRARPTRTRTRAGPRHTGHPRPAGHGPAGPSQYPAPAPPAPPGPTPAAAPPPESASACAAAPCPGRTGARAAQ